MKTYCFVVGLVVTCSSAVQEGGASKIGASKVVKTMERTKDFQLLLLRGGFGIPPAADLQDETAMPEWPFTMCLPVIEKLRKVILGENLAAVAKPKDNAPATTTTTGSKTKVSSSKSAGARKVGGKSKVISVHSAAEFKKAVAAAGKGKLVVVDFFATWCGPCQQIAPKFAELATEYSQVVFIKVDVDECQEVSQQYGVEAMPTFVFLKDGKEVEKLRGADAGTLRNKVTQLGGKPKKDPWAGVGAGRRLG